MKKMNVYFTFGLDSIFKKYYILATKYISDIDNKYEASYDIQSKLNEEFHMLACRYSEREWNNKNLVDKYEYKLLCRIEFKDDGTIIYLT